MGIWIKKHTKELLPKYMIKIGGGYGILTICLGRFEFRIFKKERQENVSKAP